MQQSLRICVIAAALLLTACSAQSPLRPPQKKTAAVASSAAGSEASVRAGSVVYGSATGYLVLPQGVGPFPALILIHEFWGLNDNMRRYAEEFAKQGYAALAVDLYGESTQDAARARELAAGVRANMEPAFANLRDAVAYLRSRPDIAADRLASVGWCFGGGWSYQMAKNDLGVQASVMYYGQFSLEDDLSMMKAQIIGHFGENDESIPVEDVREFRAKLQTQSGEHQIFIYPNEGHGFARELESESARLAWQRTLEFLQAVL